MKRTLYSGIAILALMLGGCSSTSTAPTAKKEVAPAVPIGGQSAIFYMYQAARQWKGDAQILTLENVNLESVQPTDGKYGAWRATFVSLTAKSQKLFTYSVVEEGTIPKGTYSGSESIYAPKAAMRVIPIQKVKTDTPSAVEIARNQLKDVIAKNPDASIQIAIEWNYQTTNPAWRVIIGPSLSKSLGSIYVDTETGKFIKKLK